MLALLMDGASASLLLLPAKESFNEINTCPIWLHGMQIWSLQYLYQC